MNIAEEVSRHLSLGGACLVGFADLSPLPADVRHDLPRAVAFAVPLAPEIVASIADGPTREYYDEYRRVNNLLGELSDSTADLLRSFGFAARSSAATDEGIDPNTYSTVLPHKTAATLAGLGWIGKSALLVTERFGSAVRLNRVLTDAPLPTATPIETSRCGECRVCVDHCPGTAVKGHNWQQGTGRDSFFDAFDCRRSAREIAERKTNIVDTFCGICIAACPWTKAYCARTGSERADNT
jgi:epoxyqueuosine reductase